MNKSRKHKGETRMGEIIIQTKEGSKKEENKEQEIKQEELKQETSKQEKINKINQIKKIRKEKKKKVLIAIGIIILSIAVILAIIFIIPKINNTINDNKLRASSSQTEFTQKEIEKQKEKAIKTAIKQFKKVGENVKEEDLQVQRIQRKGKLYYYISSPNNTVEVSVETNKISRINSVPVEE